MSHARILLDAAYGPGVGYGHLSRLSLLGAAIQEIMGETVGWLRRNDGLREHPGRKWLDVPEFEADELPTGNIQAVVCDGTTPGPLEYAYPFVFAIAGSYSELGALSEMRLNRAAAIYLQRAQNDELQGNGLPVTYAGGRWIIARNPTDGPRDGSHIVVSFGGSEQGKALTLDVLGYLVDRGVNALIVWPETWGPAPKWRGRIEFLSGVRSLPSIVRERARAFVGSFGITTWEVLRACVPGVYYSWSLDHAVGYLPLVDGRTVFNAGMAWQYDADVLDKLIDLAEPVAHEPRPFVDAHLRLNFDGDGVARVAADIVNRLNGKVGQRE